MTDVCSHFDGYVVKMNAFYVVKMTSFDFYTCAAGANLSIIFFIIIIYYYLLLSIMGNVP